MGELNHSGLALPGQVVLAHERPFRFGELSIYPATRQVERGDASETLEPRVMQVLVALAKANGAIVTRDELIEQCWAGRIVGEDSINRALSRVRLIASGIGEGCFTIETITKVGYRLIDSTIGRTVEEPRRREARQSGVGRRALIASGVATALVGLGGVGWRWWGDRQTEKPTSPKAQMLYEQAYSLRFTGFVHDNRQAIAYLRAAVREDPRYGAAWGALALCYLSAIYSEPAERVKGFEAFRDEAIRQARLYDPGNADADAAAVPTYSPYQHWAEFEALHRRQIRRHPEHWLAYSSLGFLMMNVGRWEDAVHWLAAASGRNSYSPMIQYKRAVALWSSGQISEAEDVVEAGLRQWPQQPAIWNTKLMLLAATGRAVMALEEASDPAKRPFTDPDFGEDARIPYFRALISGSPGDTANAIAFIHRNARRTPGIGISAAIWCAALGNVGTALDMLEGAFLGHGEWKSLVPADRMSFFTHPLFQPHARKLWHEKRFERFLVDIELEEYWKKTRSRPDYRGA